LQGFAGPSVYYNILWLAGPFISHLTATDTPPVLTQQMATLVAQLEASNNQTQQQATIEFYAQVWCKQETWIDQTNQPIG
jgi:hypothetical protein